MESGRVMDTVVHGAGVPRSAPGSGSQEVTLQAADIAAFQAPPPHRVQRLELRDVLGPLGPLRLLDTAEGWLVPGPATLVIDDRFLLQVPAVAQPGPALLDSFLATAGRCGWRPQGAPEVTADEVGPQARCRIVLHREAAPASRLHAVAPADAHAMRRLFEDIFGQPMSEAHWHWKYGEGRGHGIAITRDGRMLAHYGGITRQVLWQGRPAQACQVCDVMVAPEANRALVRKGPMHTVSATFLEEHLGWHGTHPLAYGFPSDRHHVLAERLQLYTGVDSIHRASWPAVLQSVDGQVEVLDDSALAPGGRRVRAVARLWQAMAQALVDQVVGVRDAAWLRYRYLQRPGLSYRLLYLRRGWTRRPVGVVVLRLHEQHAEVLDLVADPADFAALIVVARGEAARAGLQRVDCWITQSQLHRVGGIAAADCTTAPVGITVPANIHTPGPVDDVRGRWFLMAGDADFT
jgi:hypothetical protein